MAWRLPMFLVFLAVLAPWALAQDSAPEAAAEVVIEPPAPDAPVQAPTTSAVSEELTLMMMFEQGGVILWIILVLGFIALVLALYLLLTITPRREAPSTLVKRTLKQLNEGEIRETYNMVEDRDELLANVLRAGLKVAGRDRFVVQEAMESEGERGAAALWQRITYLHNIATLAPLLGLLGTVWGLMQAFGAIAFDPAQVRGIAMAYSVSLAMITTAAGLVVAIPAMAIHFYLRGRVVKILAAVEGHASEFVELIVKAPEK